MSKENKGGGGGAAKTTVCTASYLSCGHDSDYRTVKVRESQEIRVKSRRRQE